MLSVIVGSVILTSDRDFDRDLDRGRWAEQWSVATAEGCTCVLLTLDLGVRVGWAGVGKVDG